MQSVPTVTSDTLLHGLADRANHAVWGQFVGRYRPVLVGFAHRLGLAGADAEEAAQRSLIAFGEGYLAGKYDRSKGRLRSWLMGISIRQIKSVVRENAKRALTVSDRTTWTTFLDRLPADGDLSDRWDAEWQQAIVRECLLQIGESFDPTTLAAFELYALQERSAADVAEELGITVNAVYLAKHKIIKRMRDVLPDMEEIW